MGNHRGLPLRADHLRARCGRWAGGFGLAFGRFPGMMVGGASPGDAGANRSLEAGCLMGNDNRITDEKGRLHE